MAQVLEFLLLKWEIWINFQAPGFYCLYRAMWAFGESVLITLPSSLPFCLPSFTYVFHVSKRKSLSIREAGIVVKFYQPPSVMLASHIGIGFCPSCSTSCPALRYMTWEKQWKIAQVLGILPPMWENQMKLLVPGFSLVQSCLWWPSLEWTSRWKISFFFSSSSSILP